jgi:broad specificity phosphatase PhoE
MSTARLTLISHAATEAQHRGAFPLDEPVLNHETTKTTGLNLRVPAAAKAWSAPEQRTQQTSRMLRLSVTLTDGLRDCDYGRWRGRKMDEVQTEDPEGILQWLSDSSAAPHGGEPRERLVDRVGSWMDEQRSIRYTVAVTHPAIIRAAVVHALQISVDTFWRIDVAPLTLTDLRFTGNVWTVRCSGCPLRIAKHGENEDIDM